MKDSEKTPIELQAEQIFKKVDPKGDTIILEVERRAFDPATGERLSKPYNTSIPLRGAFNEIVRLIQYCGFNEKNPTVKFIRQEGIPEKKSTARKTTVNKK